jgi:mevalonate kinase
MIEHSESSEPKPVPFGERKEKGNSLPPGGREGDGAVFNSKLLLFGEYGLMYDAMALSIPHPEFSGFLDLDSNHTHPESTAEIRKFYEHLKSGDTSQQLHFSFDLESLEGDLARGLFFNSNIPQQYGVGSSGALVAALFSRYAANTVPEADRIPKVLKVDFSLLESFFHGRSSGLDPLISFLNKPLLIDSKKAIHTVPFDLAQTGLSIALIDTLTTGATGPLVQHFIDRFNVPEFEKAFENQFIPANNDCIRFLMNNNSDSFFIALEQLIRFELQYFRRMIPGDFHTVISEALDENVYIKLLGSGGGGFLLAFAESESDMQQWVKKYSYRLLKVV